MVEDTLTIGKKVFDVKTGELNQADLKFYVDNPRVYSALRSNTEHPSQKEIEDLMVEMEHVKVLRQSIETNGGLIDPLIVRDGDFVVLEGNSRLAAYRILCRLDPVKWGKVKCTLLPADIDDSCIFALLGQYHIVGRKDWSPFEQGGYLYRRKTETKLPIEAMAKELGITVGDAKRWVDVYELMLKHDCLVPEKWSYFEEMHKNRAIKKYREQDESIETVVVEAVKKGTLNQAMDVRKLGDIVKNKSKQAKRAIERIKSGESTIQDEYEGLQATGQISDLISKLERFKNIINEPDFEKTLLSSTSETRSTAKFHLEKIGKRIDKLVKKLEQ